MHGNRLSVNPFGQIRHVSCIVAAGRLDGQYCGKKVANTASQVSAWERIERRGTCHSHHRRRAAVNVSDGDGASFGHRVFVSLVLRTFADQPSGGPYRLRLDALLPQLQLMGLPFRSPGERVTHGMPEHEVGAR